MRLQGAKNRHICTVEVIAMRTSLNLAVTGTEEHVRAFGARAAVQGSRIGPMAPRASETARAAMGNLWVWEIGSKEVPADSRADEELRSFLKSYSHLVSTISEWNDRIVDVVVTVVSEYKDDELASGYSFDAETISLLKGFRATLEIDIVRQLT